MAAKRLDRSISATARETGADVLQGSILFGQAGLADGHGDIRRASGPLPCCRRRQPADPPRRAGRDDRPWFDPQFALSGGEDQDFFVRLSKAGKRFAWSDEARAHGDVPDTRANLGWLLRRAYSVAIPTCGCCSNTAPAHSPGSRIPQNIGVALVVAAAAAILAASPNRRAIPLQKLFRAAASSARCAVRATTSMLWSMANDYPGA